MCGISGMLRLTREAIPLPLDELARIDAALARRGPDGHAAWRSPSGRVALAHRRLAILDLSDAAGQPMRSADGRFTLVYNGELYDYRRVRAGLEREGATFRTDSDTEVLLELLARHGVTALGRFRGMFAFALWDELRGELLLARDPYGIKPLYYSTEGGVLRFASQVKALEAGGGVSMEIDPAGVASFLAWGAVAEPYTIRRSIRALPAGHALTASAENGLRLEPRPWALSEDPPIEPLAAIEESVRDHLVSDVPVAIFLSAGLDSALVASLAARHAKEPPVALTLTWDEVSGTPQDEEPLAREVAQQLGLRHVVRRISGEEVREALPEILAAMDQPSIDGFNTWLVARVAKEAGFKVALSGLGGDELLGGYPSFRDVPRWTKRVRWLNAVPGLAAIWPHLAARFAPQRPKLAGLLEHGGSLAGGYALRRGLFLPREIDQLLNKQWPEVAAERPYDAVVDSWERLDEGALGDSSGTARDPWRTVQRLESSLYLSNQLLRDADWAGMAHGVEIRVPLVDARLAQCLSSDGFQVARMLQKAGVAQAMATGAPSELFARRKTGFQLPIGAWLDSRDAPVAGSVGGQSRFLAYRMLQQMDARSPLERHGPRALESVEVA